jgi:Domain of unknown function (DUF4286)
MFIYNVTTKANHSIAAAWLHWLKEEHIADVINTGCFSNAVVLHLLEADDDEGVTYAVQYHCESKYAGEMRKKVIDKWGDKVIAFRSVMQVVN